MDEDLLGVLIVLGILGVGGVGAVILLVLYAEPVRKFLRFRKHDEEDPEKGEETPQQRKKTIKRTHIVVAQGKNVFEIDEVNKSVRKVTAPARKLTVAVHPMSNTGSTSLPSSPMKKEAPVNIADLEHGKVERTCSAPAHEPMDNASSVSGSGLSSKRGILRPLVHHQQSQQTNHPPRKQTVLIISEGNRYRKFTSNTPSLPNSPETEVNYLPGYRPPSDRRSSCS
ncbi:unnamed protein product, partial [Mesorhabditis belari]|uniref:Uncharacterized protein n=1 Tax=Mesorhabditis belari TaxID=2138241 RepID=A0AAF3F7V9_9BILA